MTKAPWRYKPAPWGRLTIGPQLNKLPHIICAVMWLAQAASSVAASPATVAQGEKIFGQSCSVGYCHGAAGAAGRGPRLRGRAFDRTYLLRVTTDGIPSSAMPAWKGRLSDQQIGAVVDYIMSLASAPDTAPPANPMPPGAGPAAVGEFKGPAQAGRGHALFFDAARDTHCGTCHSLGGRGIAVGPDLSVIAKKTPKQIAAAMRNAPAQHVLTARLRDGESFPALRVEQAGDDVKLYDLTTPPPVLRTLLKAEIESMTPNPEWRHSQLSAGLTDAQLADLIAYVKWAASGQSGAVKAQDLN